MAPYRALTCKRTNRLFLEAIFMTQISIPDLNPARWLWYPSSRCLQNTFVLFRRTLELPAKPKRAIGWISADSRYLLHVNGERVQWGPAPCDPRWVEMDPVDLTDSLHAGVNVLGAQVLFFGQGDGTSPLGKPGFLFWLEIEGEDGSKQRVVSDPSWLAHLARSWQPGHYKRWYLRALQEEFDARLHPYGWTESGFTPIGIGCPPWRSIARLTNLRSVPPFPSINSKCAATPVNASCARGQSRCCARHMSQ